MPDERAAEHGRQTYEEWVDAQKESVGPDSYAKWQGEQDTTSQSESESNVPEDKPLTRDEVQRLIQEARNEERAKAQANAPLSLVPNHAGGIGVDNPEESWSQYDQELAASGEHPLQKS